VENKEKQKEDDISSLFLWGATILYIAILCMSFAGLAVTKPTVGAAFLDFTKDYGSLLAGIPVLIAVLVAKQQLDANRRQHVAQIKRGLREELEALEKLQKWAQNISNATMETASKGIFFEHTRRLYIFTQNVDEIEQWKGNLPNKLHQLALTFFDDISHFNKRIAKTQSQINFATDELEEIIKLAKEIEKDVNTHYAYLSQYWS
jgi:hypothetical protein